MLLHERHHLRRRDPLRYLVLHALSAGLFMLPLALVLQRWAETRMELAADRAALAASPAAPWPAPWRQFRGPRRAGRDGRAQRDRSTDRAPHGATRAPTRSLFWPVWQRCFWL